jgi:hypothetical protein
LLIELVNNSPTGQKRRNIQGRETPQSHHQQMLWLVILYFPREKSAMVHNSPIVYATGYRELLSPKESLAEQIYF